MSASRAEKWCVYSESLQASVDFFFVDGDYYFDTYTDGGESVSARAQQLELLEMKESSQAE